MLRFLTFPVLDCVHVRRVGGLGLPGCVDGDHAELQLVLLHQAVDGGRQRLRSGRSLKGAALGPTAKYVGRNKSMKNKKEAFFCRFTHLSLPLYLFWMMYLLILAPPSDAGGSHSRSQLLLS